MGTPPAAVNTHIRALMGTCWRLGGLAELWNTSGCVSGAHSLGYRGHILTKSRRYSTTYGALRADRADHLRASAAPAVDDTDTVERRERIMVRVFRVSESGERTLLRVKKS